MVSKWQFNTCCFYKNINPKYIDRPNDDNRLIIKSMLIYSKGESSKFLTLKKIIRGKVDTGFYRPLKNCYYIFQKDQNRLEMFFRDEDLFLIGDKNLEKQSIHKFIPTLKKFDFEILDEFLFWFNENNFLVKHKKNNIIVNDYSYANLSVVMPDSWYEKLGRFLWEGKV